MDKMLEKCPCCRQTFRYRMQRDRHIAEDHPNYVEEKKKKKDEKVIPFKELENGRFACIYCTQSYPQKNNIYRHIKVCKKVENND